METSITCKDLNGTKALAEIFAQAVKTDGCFVSLFGEIGAGKTTFTKYALKSIGVEKKVTSPSFVILNEYHGSHLPVYHFDLYRLENEGLKTISEELREYSREGVLTLVEWADYGITELPFDRLNIHISYGSGDERVFKFESASDKHTGIIKKIEEKWSHQKPQKIF